MSFGLSEKSLNLITDTLKARKEIEKAAIFGSRSLGNHKNGSDVDLAIYGENITGEVTNSISVKLNEVLPLPYYFDVVHYDSLDHAGLKEHIDKYGVDFYKRDTNL